MPRAEKKLVDWLNRHMLVFGFLFAVLCSAVIRYKLLDFYTNDMNVFLLPWVDIFRVQGLAAFKDGVGDYNPLYLLILAAIARLTDSADTSMHAIKLVSIVFDYLLAGGVAYAVYNAAKERPVEKRRRWAWFAFAVATLLPLQLMNSALWGQCDSIYVCFAVWAVAMLLKDRWIAAFVLFGLGVCFKLQIIFLLPLLVMLYFLRRQFSVLLFAIPPALLWLSTIPAILQGASVFTGFETYLKQIAQYGNIFIDYPSISALSQDDRHEFFSAPLVLAALLACLCMLGLLTYYKKNIRGEGLVALACWSAMCCVCLLPSIHERYGYMVEVLLWVWALAFPSRRSVVPAIVFTFTGYCSYSGFLFHFQPVPFQYLAVLNLVTFLWVSWNIVRYTPADGDMPARRSRLDMLPPPGRQGAGGKTVYSAQAVTEAAPVERHEENANNVARNMTGAMPVAAEGQTNDRPVP